MPEPTRTTRILLSNDDSIHAAGFATLERIAASLSQDVWVCAPETEQSAASHSLTIHRPLRLREVSERRFTVDGTPTDSVLVGVHHILRERRPDLVLSGINHGRNIAEDVTYSGTIAAAMEATLLGIPAIALSQEIAEAGAPDWHNAETMAPDIIRRVCTEGWPAHVLININFPAVGRGAVKGVRVVPHGNREISDALDERIDPRGRRYFWIGTSRAAQEKGKGTDIEALADGFISITPIYLDLSHYPTIESLKGQFA